MQPKIFGIGAHKTASTSLGLALRELGFKTCPEAVGYRYLKESDHDKALKRTSEFEAFEDSPWNHVDLLPKLYDKHPEAIYILTTRPSDEWAESYFRFIQKFGGWQRFPHPKIFESLYGAPGVRANKEIMIANYEARNQKIRTFFKQRPEAKFFEIDINSLNYTTLCACLEIKDVPQKPFPNVNKTKR